MSIGKIKKIIATLSIKAKLVILLAFIAVLPLSIAGVYGIYYSIKALEDTILHRLSHEISSKADDIGKFLETVHKDALLLSQTLAFKELINSGVPGDSERYLELRKRAEAVFFAFSENRPYYYQIRYINNRGDEIIRVDSDGRASVPIPFSQLQYKGDRYYFQAGMEYPEGECYVSPMDANVEKGEVEFPPKPVVRVATPVFTAGKEKKGIVIINIYGSYIIEQMQRLNIAEGGTTSLLNREGLYISHMNADVTGHEFLFGSTKDLSKDFPRDIVSAILSGKRGTVRAPESIISYAPIFTGDRISKDYWILSIVYPKNSIFASIRKLEIFYILIGIGSLFIGAVVGVWLARRFTRPILELHHGVEWIAEGNFDHKLNIKTGDEIEVLATRFNTMADSLKVHREKMQRWNEDLQQEVKNRTKDLEIEKKKLENILMCASEGIVVADEDDKVIIINAAAEAFLGVKKEEIWGKDIIACHRDREKVREFLRGKKTSTSRVTTIGSRVVEISVATIPAEGNRCASMMVIHDITDRQKLLEERMTVEKLLFQADKIISLGEISAGIAHEVGNPLAAIKAVIQAMEEESPLRGHQRKYMMRILKEIDRLTQFIKAFSAFAHSGVVVSAKCKADTVLKDVILLIRNEALKNRVTIIEDYEKDTPEALIDHSQLRQVLLNLFVNAIQAMPEGGKISARIVQPDNERIRISISDTGQGIPPENIEKIFSPFFTTKPTGTGLGLSIVSRIIREYNGTIMVRSQIGEGTTFTVELPLTRATNGIGVA